MRWQTQSERERERWLLLHEGRKKSPAHAAREGGEDALDDAAADGGRKEGNLNDIPETERPTFKQMAFPLLLLC